MTHSIKCAARETITFVHRLTVQNKLAKKEHKISWQKHDIKIQGEIFCSGGGFEKSRLSVLKSQKRGDEYGKK